MSELSDKAIEQLQQAVKGELIIVDGEELTTRPVYRVPLEQYQKEPQPATLTLHSLTALVEYVNSVDKGKLDAPLFIHVESPSRVTVLTDLYGISKQRDALIVALFDHERFGFGEYLDNEDFIVMLLSRFVGTTERAGVLRVVGNIKSGQVTQRQDDGMTQTVTAKAGVVRVEEVDVPIPVHLAPFRTFPEVNQPVSPFILRMEEGDPLPQCALFEADGGAWQNEARQSIKDFLKAALPEATILA